MAKHLSTLKILDLSRVFSGPFATRHFADIGAKVIKIEPLRGDDSRTYPPLIKNWSGYYEVLNRHKSLLNLDLKRKKDLEHFYHLCESADVVVENFRPGVTKRLQIEYQTLKKINPKIIYASIVGISESNSRKYYDVLAQAESGLMSLNGESGDMKNATSIIDAFAGMKLAFAIATALYQREVTGEGSKIVVSMRGVGFDLLEHNLVETSLTKKNPKKVGNNDAAIAPFGLFNTATQSLVLAIGNQTQWSAFEEKFLLPINGYKKNSFSTNDLRLQNLDELIVFIEKAFSRSTADDLLAPLAALGIAAAKVATLTDVIADQTNFQAQLLDTVTIPNVGEIVVPKGGIRFSNIDPPNYIPAPKSDSK